MPTATTAEGPIAMPDDQTDVEPFSSRARTIQFPADIRPPAVTPGARIATRADILAAAYLASARKLKTYGFGPAAQLLTLLAEAITGKMPVSDSAFMAHGDCLAGGTCTCGLAEQEEPQ